MRKLNAMLTPLIQATDGIETDKGARKKMKKTSQGMEQRTGGRGSGGRGSGIGAANDARFEIERKVA